MKSTAKKKVRKWVYIFMRFFFVCNVNACTQTHTHFAGFRGSIEKLSMQMHCMVMLFKNKNEKYTKSKEKHVYFTSVQNAWCTIVSKEQHQACTWFLIRSDDFFPSSSSSICKHGIFSLLMTCNRATIMLYRSQFQFSFRHLMSSN